MSIIRTNETTLAVPFSFNPGHPDSKQWMDEVRNEWDWTLHYVLETVTKDGTVILPGPGLRLGWFEIVDADTQQSQDTEEELSKLYLDEKDCEHTRLAIRDWLSDAKAITDRDMPTVRCILQAPPNLKKHELN